MVKILYLEDDPLDVKLVRETLAAEDFPSELCVVDSREEFVRSLESGEVDLILADYRVPGFSGKEAMTLALERKPDTPFIFISGAIGEEKVIKLMRQGVTDCVLKDHLARLAPSLRRALDEAKEQRLRREADRELRESNLLLTQVLESVTSQLDHLFENRQALIAHLDAQFNILRVNRAFATAHKQAPGSLEGKNYFALYPNPGTEAVFRSLLETGEPYSARAKPLDLFGSVKGADTLWDWDLQPVKNERGDVEGLLIFLLDATQRKKAQSARIISETRFRQLVENLDSIIIRFKPDRSIIYANSFARQFFNLPKAGLLPIDALGSPACEKEKAMTDRVPPFIHAAGRPDSHSVADCEHHLSDGKTVWVRWTYHKLSGVTGEVEEILSVGFDITGHKLLEQEMLRDQQRLRSFVKNTGTTLHGLAVSPGLAEGTAFLYRPRESHMPENRQIVPHEVDSELSRFDRALLTSARELESLKERLFSQLAEEEKGIIDVHLTLLKDPSFVEKCRQSVQNNLMKVEHAVSTEIQNLENLLQGLEQEFARERSADVRDIGQRVLRNLQSAGDVPEESPEEILKNLPPGTVIVAEQLLPSDTLSLNRKNAVAFITEKDGSASHAAILARAMGIPAIADVRKAMSLLMTGDRLLVDAVSGTITVAPTGKQTAHFAVRKAQHSEHDQVPAGGGKKSTTQDGVGIALQANIGQPGEARLVDECGLDGVGLFRSEFLFLKGDRPPDLKAQYAAYSSVARLLQPRPVVIRTMDLGGDKIPRFSRKDAMAKSHGNKRGLAYSLSEKTLFRTQLQAIVRATGNGNVRIMFPMVMGVADLREALIVLEEIIETEKPEHPPAVGVMIETPAAVFSIHEILELVDFVSIGTNDLAHYILALDRESPESAGALALLHPGVLRAVETVVRAAQEHAVEVSVCGEAASEPATACLLIGMGVRTLSMSPFLADPLRPLIRKITIERAERLAREALAAVTPKEIQTLLSAAMNELGSPSNGQAQ
jgi:phosphotransferase system enzyme I (PtsI)